MAYRTRTSITFVVGEIAHFRRGYRSVPDEVEIISVTDRRIAARSENGETLRFRARDLHLVGWPHGPELLPLNRAAAEEMRRSLELEKMRKAIFDGADFALQGMQRWSINEQTLRQVAAEYRAFLRRAITLGAEVPKELRQWLDLDTPPADHPLSAAERAHGIDGF